MSTQTKASKHAKREGEGSKSVEKQENQSSSVVEEKQTKVVEESAKQEEKEEKPAPEPPNEEEYNKKVAEVSFVDCSCLFCCSMRFFLFLVHSRLPFV